jgi:hypothetical protein
LNCCVALTLLGTAMFEMIAVCIFGLSNKAPRMTAMQHREMRCMETHCVHIKINEKP